MSGLGAESEIGSGYRVGGGCFGVPAKIPAIETVLGWLFAGPRAGAYNMKPRFRILMEGFQILTYGW